MIFDQIVTLFVGIGLGFWLANKYELSVKKKGETNEKKA